MDDDIQYDMYKVVDDIIYYKDKIYLVPKTQIKEWIAEEDISTNIVKLICNGNLGSISSPPNKQALPIVV